MKKNVSTAKNPAVTNKKKNYSTSEGIPAMLTLYLSLTENICPKMTHNIERTFIPLKMFK